MAEFAIPLIALGSMYVLSNQNVKKEEFANMGKKQNYLPNVDPRPHNMKYPTDKINNNNIKKYVNPNQATDKYFSESVYKNAPKQKSDIGVENLKENNHLSLTGGSIDIDNFKHNNMVPFFGARIRGPTLDANIAESRLDNLQGSGSQMIKKTETAPLFKPQKDIQNSNGAPNNSEFYLSRQNPSMYMSNIKPWEEIQVAPGLNKGFNSNGGVGFNSGMESREMWLPKNVDQLRVKNNPKLSFELSGHQGPANSHIQEIANSETQGKVEKYLPDKFFEQSSDRWLKTTGSEKAQRIRAKQELNDVNRTTTTSEYYGVNGNQSKKTYIKGEYEETIRKNLAPTAIINAHASGQYKPDLNSNNIKSYKTLSNNRSTTNSDTFGSIQGLVKAMISPIFDVLRPSKKENVVGNLRQNGNMHKSVSNHPIYNPADITKTTIREMTTDKVGLNHLNVNKQNAQSGNGYLVSEHQGVELQRDNTNVSYSGVAGPSLSKATRDYKAEYEQRNNNNKTSINRPNQGGTQMFNQNNNIKIQKQDCDRNNNRLWVRNNSKNNYNSTPNIESYNKITKKPQNYQQINNDRMNPEILDAFKKNPYTKPLNSWI